MRQPITIIGGGLAGLTLGIGLRQRGVPVTVHEAGTYPRHRVCGEFISGRGLGVLERLGLREPLLRAGAIEARTVRFYIGDAATPVRTLAEPALTLSRFLLDAALASQFRDLAGELQTGSRLREPHLAPGTVRATGRRLRSTEHGWRWFGLKLHAVGVSLEADLEMHAQPGGYVGLCNLGDGEVNVCGVFRRRAGAERENWRDLLRGAPGTALYQRLRGAEFLEPTFCSVAGLSLRPVSARHLEECCVGDAITMTPPVTGNGMSMAFEAAELAIAPLLRYSTGEVSWDETRRAIAEAADSAFQSRLRWARLLQWLMFTPLSRGPAGRVLLKSGGAWNWFYRHTR